MANFTTHIGVAASAGAVIAASGLSAQLWPLTQAPAIVLLVALGGIMPDIDADKSHSTRLIFTVLAITAALAALALTQTSLSWLGATCLALGLYVGIRDVFAVVFRALTRHRASWHSLLAIAGVMFSTVTISFRCFGQPARLAWSDGLAVALGMLIHLLLDECFSIDLEGARLKRSFGTALKLFDYRRPYATALMASATMLIMPWMPRWPF
ncbi:MAG: metal-dependent hydrolase [Salinisphaera sp.]|uniref:metal-dependent hydrolase n=1 Tax=Salinisphaera sp. TaxID=1914330 RepID=UPI003C7C6503